MTTTTTKIKAVSIEFPFSESPHLKSGLKYEGEDCWTHAQAALNTASNFAPKNGAYDKTDFIITWEDGEAYQGRIDLQHPDYPHADYRLAEHISHHLKFHGGLGPIPSHMNEDKYEQYLHDYVDRYEGGRQMYLDYLEKYDIPWS